MSQQWIDVIDGQFWFSFFWPILVAVVTVAALSRRKNQKTEKNDRDEQG